MNTTKREFIINELMVKDFAEYENRIVHLEETEDSGRSILEFRLASDGNLCIKNVDCKNTQIQFFQNAKTKSMFKRVDHIIFEHLTDNHWKLHLIEMKSSVGSEKWVEIKGKFRASYLLAQGIAAMLEMHIDDAYMYTTYESVHLSLSETMPTARRLPLGGKLIKPQEEWEGSNFGLNFGVRIKFVHRPIQMERSENMLKGMCICS
ncbi:MAG: hypothetical protein MR383_02755 [Lachnospiraceae bacterium]|nr:hypothetical protein [Lachnospiraceae bacterium]